MNMTDKAPLFFAGVNAGGGYISHMGKIYDPDGGWRTYLIKGGAGMGKSTLMKYIAGEMSKHTKAWLAPCPSDPDSLDAAVFPDIKACIMDATAPHIVNPVYPEVCEVTVNLGDHCDRRRLSRHRDEIIGATKAAGELYARSGRYIAAASSLLSDSYRVAYECTDMTEAARYGTQLAEKVIPKGSGHSEEQLRFLSAVTPKGFLYLSGTLQTMCDRLFIIEDEHGAASRAIMSAIRLTALRRGHRLITCMCPFAPDEKTEHIILPDLRLGFTTENRYLHSLSDERRIHARRFTQTAAISGRRQRLSFNRRAAAELIKGAVSAVSQAKAIHDSVEAYYIECMDFDGVNARRDEILKDLLSRL